MSRKCAYIAPDRNTKCARPARGSSANCVFHEPVAEKRVGSNRFAALLKCLDRKGDGNWVGFRFPDSFIFERNACISSKIDLRYATVNVVSIKQVTFENHILADYIEVGGPCYISANMAWIRSRNSTVLSDIHLIVTCKGAADFIESVFHGPATFGGEWSGEFRLGRARFLSFVEFFGGWHIFLTVGTSKPQPPPKKKPLFAGEADLQNVRFAHPEQVHFKSVSLEKTLFSGTDIFGAHFYDVTWATPDPDRLGLYDEKHIVGSSDKSYPARALPRLETAYRSFRLALEKNHDFSTATDFYVGEMETRRRRRNLGQLKRSPIEFLYRMLSLYGSSPTRAFLVLLGLAALHFVLNQGLICAATDSGCAWSIEWTRFAEQAANSLRVISLQRFVFGSQGELLPFQGLLDATFAALAPIQIALLVLAIRARIRR